jgi:hypothetical protein
VSKTVGQPRTTSPIPTSVLQETPARCWTRLRDAVHRLRLVASFHDRSRPWSAFAARDRNRPATGQQINPHETASRADYQPIREVTLTVLRFPVGTAHQLLFDQTDGWTKLLVLGVASNAPSDCAVCGFVNKNPCAISQLISISVFKSV